MSSHRNSFTNCWQTVLLPAVVAWVVLAGANLLAQTTTTTTPVATFGAVGGVRINPDGSLTNAIRDALGDLQKLRADALRDVPDGMNRTAGLRKVSLAGLEREIQKCIQAGIPLPVAVQCLAGLQQIRYVLVYPDEQDIVLVGPAEGWKLDDRGNFLARKTAAR